MTNTAGIVKKMQRRDARVEALAEAVAIADEATAHWFSQAMAAQKDGDDESAKGHFKRRDVASDITRKIQALMSS